MPRVIPSEHPTPAAPQDAAPTFQQKFFWTAKTWLECRHALINVPDLDDPLFTLVGELDAAHELHLLITSELQERQRHAIES